MEKLREWFGSRSASAKTVGWVLWASFLISIALGLVLVVIVALSA